MAADIVGSKGQNRERALLAGLEAEVASSLLGRKLAGDTVRVWLPDCGSGEVAYAVVMVLYAYAQQRDDPPAIQIFATDNDANAITTARYGRYHESLESTVPPEYLQRYCYHDQQRFQVMPAVRELITFAQHFVLRDPPFAHLDLIVCQHLLSALLQDDQEHLLHEFHWCLRPHGYLVMDGEEHSVYLPQLFVRQNGAPGFFQRRDVLMVNLPVRRYLPHLYPQSGDEPLQTSNEHLLAMNQVLRRKVGELTQANTDLNNLMSATDLAIIFLDRLLQVTRFTSQAGALFNLILTDRGRPLAHIRHTLAYEQLHDDAAQVLASSESLEREVQSHNGRWYLVRLRPYRAGDGQVAGVVLICVDITERRLAEAALRQVNDELEQRVTERTEELSTANTQLQAEIAERARLEQERTELLRKLVTTQEDERRRIARELHDQLGQSISALNVGLSTLSNTTFDDGQRQQALARLRQLAVQIDQDVNQLALDLRPLALDDLGLIVAVQQHVEQWADGAGIAADFQLIGRDSRLPREVESVIFRVIQEALTNVLKHAEARNVSVILERRDSQVRVIVEDDGCGFDLEGLQQASHKRLGLLGMRERVALIGGTLTFQTAPGDGTTLFVQIPLSRMEIRD